jgi:hypothetical protein
LLRFRVAALAEVLVAERPFLVDEVERRPVVVRERVPDGVVVVGGHGIVDPHRLHLLTDVPEVVLERELRRVHAEHDEPVLLVLLAPGSDVRKRSQPVDARVGPEVDDHHAPAQALRR